MEFFDEIKVKLKKHVLSIYNGRCGGGGGGGKAIAQPSMIGENRQLVTNEAVEFEK
jgi:hypothetical protein